jgi:uncharacterized damage-inducible protein DinB
MKRRVWFDRKFTLGLPPEALADLVERLRGTAARLEERTLALSQEIRTERRGDRWSIQENVGHLLDLESLWAARLDELLAGAHVLRPADLENRKTHEAGHNSRPIAELLREFPEARAALVRRIEALSDSDLARTAFHPRLQQPMGIVDLVFFVAEHDDHHLARITAIRNEATVAR